jgi:hypothetical protein
MTMNKRPTLGTFWAFYEWHNCLTCPPVIVLNGEAVHVEYGALDFASQLLKSGRRTSSIDAQPLSSNIQKQRFRAMLCVNGLFV